MSDTDDPRLAAVERRLVARSDFDLSPGHRDRVLAAVRNTLADRAPPASTPAGIEAHGMAALVALALSAMMVIAAPWLAVTRLSLSVPVEPRLVAQARSVGIDLPAMAIAATGGPPQKSPSRPNPTDPLAARRHEAWHMRNLLKGEL